MMEVACPRCRNPVPPPAPHATQIVCPMCRATLRAKQGPDTSAADAVFAASTGRTIPGRREAAAAMNRTGGELVGRGDFRGAVRAFTEAMGADPKDAALHNNRGYVLAALREYPQAIRDFDEAIRLDPRCAGAFNNRGLA